MNILVKKVSTNIDNIKATVVLSDKRLLSIDEFCIYAGIETTTARNIAEITGALFRVGHRVLVDRVKFDRYCDENTEVEAVVK